jgi:hypothetical protein
LEVREALARKSFPAPKRSHGHQFDAEREKYCPFMRKQALKIFLPIGMAWGLASCASVSVQPDAEYATNKMPDEVYVEPFTTSGGDFKVDRDGAELAAFKQNLQVMMTTAVTTDLTHRLIPATALTQSHPPRHERAWLIRGEFRKVCQGSRLLRSTIGFGAGGTKLETEVDVYDLSSSSTRPFLTFSTTGGSNAEPGAITGLATDPVTLIVGTGLSGVSGVAHGLTEDTERTAKEITAELSDYMYRSGWIPRDKWIKPKSADPS